MNSHEEHTAEPVDVPEEPSTQDYDVGGLYFSTHRPGQQVIDEISAKLKPEFQSLFLWRAEEVGGQRLVIGALYHHISYRVFSEVRDFMLVTLPPDEAETLKELTLTRPGDAYQERAEPAPVLKSGLGFSPGDDWYWPMGQRLFETAYSEFEGKIKIGHIDTGISPHPCLRGGYSGGTSFISGGNGSICNYLDFVYPFPFIGHGTATGGFIVGQPAAGPPGGLPLFGMALLKKDPFDSPHRGPVEIVPIRVSKSVILIIEDVIRVTQAIDWAVQQGCQVINISLGAPRSVSDILILKEALEKARDKGVIVCCASGQYFTGPVLPAELARSELCVCCGPSTRDRTPSGEPAWWSFTDDYVTIGAPGVTMPRAGWNPLVFVPCKDYEKVSEAEITESSGSSYSTPYTATIAALWYAKNWVDLNNLYFKTNKKNEILSLFRSLLAQTCDPWADTLGYKHLGPGILNPWRLLNRFLSTKFPGKGQSAGVPALTRDGSYCVVAHNTQNEYYYTVGRVRYEEHNVEWGADGSLPKPWDFVSTPRVAVGKTSKDGRYHCVLVAVSKEQDKKLRYLVGEVKPEAKQISWGKWEDYDTGDWNAIALDDQGNCVEVHNKTGKAHIDIHYLVGTVDCENKKITFGGSVRYNQGETPAVALDNAGNCVEVHADGEKARLYYAVGKVQADKKIAWDLSHTGSYDVGAIASIALGDDGRCIEVHTGPSDTIRPLYYRTGKVDFTEKKITFGDSINYASVYSTSMSVAMDAKGNWIEFHKEGGGGYYLYYTVRART